MTDQAQQPNTTSKIEGHGQAEFRQAVSVNDGTITYIENQHNHQCPFASTLTPPTQTDSSYPKPNNTVDKNEQQRPKTHLLPYMVDRDTQESQIIEAIKEHARKRTQRPFICIVYGNEEHCVHQFVQVFQDKLKRGKLHSSLCLNGVPQLRYETTEKKVYFYVEDDIIDKLYKRRILHG